MILLLDNYDSFTHNLQHYLQELGAEVLVKRNDQVTLAQIQQLNPSKIVISPGPCTPNQSGICLAVIEHYLDKLPILGVCLGHQAIAQVLGGAVVRAEQVMHGKTSPVYHNGHAMFAGVNNPFNATRYHSLVVDASSLPKSLAATAWTHTSEGQIEYIMAFAHRVYPVFGVQFHPESILSESGHQLLENFLRL